MKEELKLFIKRLRTTKHHSGTGQNHSPWRLIRQGIPYYLSSQGYANNPMTVFFIINGRCNMRCRMCDIGQKEKDSMFYQNLAGDSEGDFPFERFTSLLDEFQTFKPYISVSTTEPMLYRRMWEGVAHARSRGLQINVTSNGLFLERFVDPILDSGLNRLSISIDGPEKIHDEMRGVPGSYKRIIRGLELLHEKKKQRGLTEPRVFLSAFVCDKNFNHIFELMENLPLDLVEHVNIKLMVFFTRQMVEEHNRLIGHKYPATVACFPEDFNTENFQIDELCRQARMIQEKFGDKCALHFEPDQEKIAQYYYEPHKFMDNSHCVLPWFIAQIKINGDLIVLTRCFNINLGNVMNQPFLEVWNGPKMREFRRDLRQHGRFPACARCDGVLYR